jgi:hypothetical protein
MSQQNGWGVLLVALIGLASAGCGGSTGHVSGEVTYQGKPLPVGTVVFFGSGEGSPQSTAMIANGKYEATDVPLGAVEVTVSTPEPRATPDPLAPAGTPQVEVVPIPKKYEIKGTSGLNLTVTGGSQTFDIKLE